MSGEREGLSLSCLRFCFALPGFSITAGKLLLPAGLGGATGWSSGLKPGRGSRL